MKRPQAPLSPDDVAFICAALPRGARVVAARYFDNYNLPCPVLVTVRAPNGRDSQVVFKRSRNISDHNEPEILQALRDCGLPVPTVLRTGVSSEPAAAKLTLMEHLPGASLQKFAELSDSHVRRAKAILIDGVTALHERSADIAQRVAGLAPRVTLADSLRAVEETRTGWDASPLFAEAVRSLERNLPEGDLAFTNGDLQPANFLTDGNAVTAYLDFEQARVEDRLFGFAKYMIYDLAPLNRANVVGDFLDRVGATAADFAPRLALGCLLTLQRELQPEGGDAETRAYRNRTLGILAASIRKPNAVIEIGATNPLAAVGSGSTT